MRDIVKYGLLGFAGISILALGLGLGLGLSSDEIPVDDETPVGEYIVGTEAGRVQGYRYDKNAEKYDEKEFNSLIPNIPHDSTYFLGIPYAAPPNGDRRWKAPRDPVPWDGVKQAIKYGPGCAQKCDEPCDEADSSEDCLYLNIFVPNRAIDENDKVPVGIWIHGGAFRWGRGGSILYDGRTVAGQSDMIIVTLNYRLGAFGWLYNNGVIEDGETNSGNWGFLDQQKAIKWVHNNIGNFNGDPDRIVVYGESAGAISSIQHVINEESSKYFKRAIVQSDPLAIPYKLSWEAGMQANYFGNAIGCPSLDMECMRSKSWQEVVDAAGETPIIIDNEIILHAAMPFGPVVDLNVILEQPYVSLLEGRFDKTKDIIMGQVQHETEIYVRTIFTDPVNNLMYNAAWRLLIQDTEKTDKIFERYPSLCEQNSAGQVDIAKTLSSIDWKKVTQSTDPQKLFIDSIRNVRESECSKICDTTCTDEDSRLCGLLADNELCKTNAGSNLVEQICTTLNPGCDAEEFDERRTMEPPATQWIFTCPMRKMLKTENTKQFYIYEFRDFMPIDLTKFGEGWDNYDSCAEYSCHGAELSYVFASESQLNCSAVPEYPGIDNELFQVCENDQIVTPAAKRMERFIHRMWANFARTGNPNDETGFKGEYYKTYYPEERMADLPEWKHFEAGTEGWLEISSHDNTDFKYTQSFHTADCDFWDELDVYADSYH